MENKTKTKTGQIEFAVIETEGRTYMSSVPFNREAQTAEQIVDELNLYGELNLPLFF